MSDLISRSALIKKFEEEFEQGLVESFDDVIGIVEEQPTAYDINKVIAQIAKEANHTIVDFKKDKYVYTHKAIEIVKQGGVSEDK